MSRRTEAEGDFLAVASHELRQPVQAIGLFRDALLRTALNAEQQAITVSLSRAVEALGERLQALLDLPRLAAGEGERHWRALRMEDLFAALEAEFAPPALGRGLRFKLCYPWRALCVHTDPVLLQDVLRALVDNALRYTVRGGVLVGLRCRADRALFQVWDSGPGISAAAGACFFAPPPVPTRGLGLSVVRQGAAHLGCRVAYRSWPGRGSVVELDFPLASDAGDAKPAADGDLASCTGQLVVVEDDPLLREALRLALGDSRLEVRFFPGAQALLDAPESLTADFYLVDFHLAGGCDGLQLLDILRRRASAPLRAALLTGETRAASLAILRAAGWPVLRKPLDWDCLQDLLCASLAPAAAVCGQSGNFVPGTVV